MLALVASRDPEIDTPRPDQLHTVGVVGTVARMLKVPDGTLRILVQSGPRVRLEAFTSETPYLVARVAEAPDVTREGPELTALVRNVQQTFGTSSRTSRTCQRSSRSRSPTSRTRPPWRT